MPEEATLEPPPTSDTDALKASFTAELAKAQTEAPPTEEKKVDAPAKKVDDVPLEMLGEKKDETKEEEALPANAPAKQLRDALARRDAAIAALREEVKAAKAKPATEANPETANELKTARERAQQLEQELERAAYERSPRFRRFGVEEVAELKTAKTYLEGSDISPGILDAAANASGAARVKLLTDAGMDHGTLGLVGAHLARVDALRRDRDASLETWKQSLTADQEAHKAAQAQVTQRQEAEERRVFETIKTQFIEKIPAFTKSKEKGFDAWDAQVAENLKAVDDFAFGRKPLAEIMELGFRGIAQKATEQINVKLSSRVTELESELTKLRAAQPTTGSGGEAKPPAPDPDKPGNEKAHYESSFNREMAKARGG